MSAGEPEWMWHSWYDCEWANAYAIYAPEDGDKRRMLDEMLVSHDGCTLGDLTDEQVTFLLSRMRYEPLFSVVATDAETIGVHPDDCEWHGDASGKRMRPCWWISRDDFRSVTDSLAHNQPPVKSPEPMAEPYTVQGECERYGLPTPNDVPLWVAFDGLMRHVYANRDLTIAALTLALDTKSEAKAWLDTFTERGTDG